MHNLETQATLGTKTKGPSRIDNIETQAIIIRNARVKTSNLNTDITKTEADRNLGSVLELAQQSGGN
jgi:hypothetical protein